MTTTEATAVPAEFRTVLDRVGEALEAMFRGDHRHADFPPAVQGPTA